LIVSWDERFFDPIMVPDREPLVTLRDAAEYITELPKAELNADEWQAAMQVLLLVAEDDGATDVCAHRCHTGQSTVTLLGRLTLPGKTSIGTAKG
jgi:hypothetical protein